MNPCNGAEYIFIYDTFDANVRKLAKSLLNITVNDMDVLNCCKYLLFLQQVNFSQFEML